LPPAFHDNPGLVQLLGLCPLLAVTSTFVNGLGLGLATLIVLTMSNVLVSATRRWIRSEIRIPMYVLIIASLVTCIELIFKAWFPALDRSLHAPSYSRRATQSARACSMAWQWAAVSRYCFAHSASCAN
jgi:Na+-translocating ferredoxin:NAD+ oxidoreductase RnfE subunit